MNSVLDIPEVRGLDGSASLIRIPPEVDVPMTDRVRALVDTPPFRRLTRISQLGLVSLVYPGATHTRFEHSLGVYRLALLFLRQLCRHNEFHGVVSLKDAELLIVSALLHDIGHWPFCHPIEDMGLSDFPTHEELAKQYLLDAPIADILTKQWDVDPRDVVDLLAGKGTSPAMTLLDSILSGPIDVDKMDYLMRDSLHAGVPYGRNFDQARLINSLLLNSEKNGLAISEKGRTAAEMMVFARYVMFSEVYWHHAVRSATAMLQRIVFRLRGNEIIQSMLQSTEESFVRQLQQQCSSVATPLVDGLFGERRVLFKRAAQIGYLDDLDLYKQLARRPYEWLVRCGDELSSLIAKRNGTNIPADHVLIDAPPTKLEVQFDIDVYSAKTDTYCALGDVSPVVRTLAQTQFDRIVKRVRVFVHPDLAMQLPPETEIREALRRAADALS